MRRKWLVGTAVVALVGCAVGVERSDHPAPTSPSEPSASAPASQGTLADRQAVASLQALLTEHGRVIDATSSRLVGGPMTPDLRVQIAQRSYTSTAPKSTTDWKVTTGAPVRHSPATYGASWTSNSNSDMIAFATDDTNLGGSLAGITGGVSNLPGTGTTLSQIHTSTLFVMDQLYGTAPRLLYFNSGSTTNLPTNQGFAFGGLTFSLNSANIRLYALSQNGRLFCYRTPQNPSTTLSKLSACNGWPSTGFGNAGTVTWSSAFAGFNFTTLDVIRMYYGGDNGKLYCTNTASLTAGPSACTGFTNGLSLGSAKLGPPAVNEVSATEYIIFVGDEAGNFYQIHDLNGTVTTRKYALGSGAQFGIHGSPLLDFGGLPGDTNPHAYIAAGGAIYEFPWGTSGTWAPTHSVALPLSSGSWTAPIDSSIGVDASSSTPSIYVTAAGNLYKTQPSFTATTAVTSTKLVTQTSTALSVDGTSIAAQSQPIGTALPYYNGVFVPNGAGGTSSSAATGLIEQYGCTSSAGAPVLTEATLGGPYGVMLETGLILDWANGNLNFGYDNGNLSTGKSGTGGLVQYPANNTVPDTQNGWDCPTGYSRNGSIACGGPGCVVGGTTDAGTGTCSPPGQSIGNGCTGFTPICTANGTCVQCTSHSDCPSGLCDVSGYCVCFASTLSDGGPSCPNGAGCNTATHLCF